MWLLHSCAGWGTAPRFTFPPHFSPAVVDHTLRKRLLPSWCSYLAHAISVLLLLVCFGISVWIGVGFSSSVALMWLISGIFSFLSSFLLWEPLKVSPGKRQGLEEQSGFFPPLTLLAGSCSLWPHSSPYLPLIFTFHLLFVCVAKIRVGIQQIFLPVVSHLQEKLGCQNRCGEILPQLGLQEPACSSWLDLVAELFADPPLIFSLGRSRLEGQRAGSAKGEEPRPWHDTQGLLRAVAPGAFPPCGPTESQECLFRALWTGGAVPRRAIG